MNLTLDSKLADGYTSQSHKIGLMTENWVGSQIFVQTVDILNLVSIKTTNLFLIFSVPIAMKTMS